MRDLLAITKALADENRLRAIALLQGRELCLCQIVEVLSLAPSTMSKHMSILSRARLVESRKEGRWAYFRLADSDAPSEALQALELVLASVKQDKQAKADQQQLKQVLKLEPEELCRKQASCK
ncbi:ArsR/SmtB family transcription factor [Aeoliella mucimassa]|uniref:Cadmium resistance transcriptional regulatory protein CadC n=1 Tax=Aeoliella mucimassa TaxID=2527972 RepID=A0A518ARZ4_9BACT|nr:metalloregulator ArsR/SmtB family transcription factor [Aeoliella mucimassa]QDU57495.1 Cadmium resistance transcriptional regulatory protein CadC [Aeoliella mucimassa]